MSIGDTTTQEGFPLRFFERRIVRMLTVLLALTLLAAACGGDDDDDGSADAGDTPTTANGDSATTEGGGDLSGEVVISGSSTVAPISSLVAETFQEDNGDVAVTVDGPGTGDGFKLFCDGETDISDASREIKDEEAAACEANGIEYVGLEIGIDGLTVMTSADNDAVECLTFADMYALVGPESQGIKNWNDAEPLAKELGSSTDLPDLELSVTAPGEESGTYDSFLEIAFKKIAEARAEAGKITEDQIGTSRPDYQASADDNVIIQGIEGAEGSFGWVGFAYAEEAGDQIKEIAVDGGDGCVEPSTETVADGTYPLSRSLYIYVNKAKAEENPAVAAFVDYYLNDGIGSVEEAGYIGLPDDRIAESRSAWEAR